MTEQDAIDFMANHTAQQIYDAGANGTALDTCYIGEAFFNEDDTVVQRAVLVAIDGSAAWMVREQTDGSYTAQPAKPGWVGWTPDA